LKILLDTCAALWLFRDSSKLPANAKLMIGDETNEIYMSVASTWEVAIKVSLGKLDFKDGVRRFIDTIDKYHFTLCPILPEHLIALQSLPFIHRDPFDRLIISTAQQENMTLISPDKNIRQYNILCVWE